MNYFVFSLFLSALVAGQSDEKNPTSLSEKNDFKLLQPESVLEESDDSDVEKSQQKRELYEDDALMEKQIDFMRNVQFANSKRLFQNDKEMDGKKVPYTIPYTVQRPYSHLAVEIPITYPIPVQRGEYQKESSHPGYHYMKYDVEDEKYPKDLLGGKYHKIVAAHYGEYNPYVDMPINRESEHVLPGYLYHLHMKHRGVGGLYENRNSGMEYGSGYLDEILPPFSTSRTHYQHGFGDIPPLDRRSQYVEGRTIPNHDLQQSYLKENDGLRKYLISGFGGEPKSSRFPTYQEGSRPFYPGHLLESMHKAHPVESSHIMPSVRILSETQQQPLGGNCQESEFKNIELTSRTSSLFPAGKLFRRIEQEIHQHSATPEVSVKLHQTLDALKKAEQEKEAIDHELHHIQHETDAKLQHGLQALQKANQEKHIIEKAVHHNIMQKEDNDVKLHQSLSALKLAEHQKQAIELELHNTQMEKEAKIKEELAALEKAEKEKEMIEQELHHIAQHKPILNVGLKAELKEVKPENKIKTEPVEILEVTKIAAHKPEHGLKVAVAEKEITPKLKREQTNVPKEDAAKKQALASMLKQSSLVIGAIKEDKAEKKEEGPMKKTKN